MPVHRAEIETPYTPAQMFDLVADIESYSLFLPQVVSARIVSRAGDTLRVNQVVRLKFFRLPFTTRAVLHRPKEINVTCEPNPLIRFAEQWTFTETPAGGTHLASQTTFELISAVLGRALSAAFADQQRITLQAFATRARTLYNKE